jgi:hypothetical protein
VTVPVSTAPTVKAYLLAAIQALATAVAGEQLVVIYSPPGDYQPDDIIYVGDVDNRACEPDAFVGDGGAHAFTERYELEVVCDAFRMGDYPDKVDARAWAMAAYVETAVRNDMSLGSSVIQAKPTVSRTESSWDDKHKGRRVRLTVSIEVFASL